MTPQEFETKALEGIDAIGKKQDASHLEFKTAQEKILADYDRQSKELKAAQEELTRVKNTCNDLDMVTKALAKVQAELKKAERKNFKNPLARFLETDDNRDWVNAFARRIAFPGGKLPEHLERALITRAEPMTGVDSSLGTAVVPTETATQIYDLFSSFGVWPGFDIIPVSARTSLLPIATTEPLYHWIGAGATVKESETITASFMDGGDVHLAIETLACLFPISRELLQDSTTDLSGYIMRQLTAAITRGLDYTTLTAAAPGDRAGSGYYGIFALGGVNANLIAAAAAGNTKTELLDVEDFERCLTTTNASVLNRSPKWWIHPHIMSKVMLVRDANKRPLFQSSTEAPSPGSIGSILGYPVVMADQAPSTNSASAKVAVFGDPMGMAVGVRQALEIATSDQVRFEKNQVVYRALMRAGLIAKQATTTVKPFAVLTLAAV